MSTDSRGYWREEFSLIALLLLFFIAIVALSYHIPFDARLFPLLIGSAGILLTLGISVEQVRRRGARDGSIPRNEETWSVSIGRAMRRRFCRRRSSGCCSGCSASSSPRSQRCCSCRC